MTYLLSIVYIGFLLLIIWSLWKMGIRSKMVWIITPLFIFSLGFSWIVIDSFKGWPVYEYPPADAEFQGATLQKPLVYITAQPQGSEEPRLYAIPYTKKNVNAVNEALRQKNQGQVVLTKNVEEELQFYNFDLQKKYNK